MIIPRLLTTVVCVIGASALLQADPSITNIRVTPNQQAGTISITYDIGGITTSNATVQAKASINNGSTYSVTLQNATGDLGAGITNGSGKQITWSAKKDLPYGGPFQMKIQLDAYEDRLTRPKPQYPEGLPVAVISISNKEFQPGYKSNSLKDDLWINDVLKGATAASYLVRVDSNSTFKWYKEGQVMGAGIPISYGTQILEDGVEIRFKQVADGYKPGDTWTFSTVEFKELSPDDFAISPSYKIPKTGCTIDHPILMYDDGELQIGKEMSFTDNGDGTVTDNNTGLMWVKDVMSEGGNNGKLMTPSEAASFADSLIYAGYDDWRVPTVRELVFISDYSSNQKTFHAPIKSPFMGTIFKNSEESTNNYRGFYNLSKEISLKQTNFLEESFYNLRGLFAFADTSGHYNLTSNGHYLAVRGVDQTVGDWSGMIDSNNSLEYKLINFQNEKISEVLGTLNNHNSILNGDIYLKIANSILKEINEKDTKYRIPNIKESVHYIFNTGTSRGHITSTYGYHVKYCESDCEKGNFYHVRTGGDQYNWQGEGIVLNRRTEYLLTSKQLLVVSGGIVSDGMEQKSEDPVVDSGWDIINEDSKTPPLAPVSNEN